LRFGRVCWRVVPGTLNQYRYTMASSNQIVSARSVDFTDNDSALFNLSFVMDKRISTFEKIDTCRYIYENMNDMPFFNCANKHALKELREVQLTKAGKEAVEETCAEIAEGCEDAHCSCRQEDYDYAVIHKLLNEFGRFHSIEVKQRMSILDFLRKPEDVCEDFEPLIVRDVPYVDTECYVFINLPDYEGSYEPVDAGDIEDCEAAGEFGGGYDVDGIVYPFFTTCEECGLGEGSFVFRAGPVLCRHCADSDYSSYTSSIEVLEDPWTDDDDFYVGTEPVTFDDIYEALGDDEFCIFEISKNQFDTIDFEEEIGFVERTPHHKTQTTFGTSTQGKLWPRFKYPTQYQPFTCGVVTNLLDQHYYRATRSERSLFREFMAHSMNASTQAGPIYKQNKKDKSKKKTDLTMEQILARKAVYNKSHGLKGYKSKQRKETHRVDNAVTQGWLSGLFDTRVADSFVRIADATDRFTGRINDGMDPVSTGLTTILGTVNDSLSGAQMKFELTVNFILQRLVDLGGIFREGFTIPRMLETATRVLIDCNVGPYLISQFSTAIVPYFIRLMTGGTVPASSSTGAQNATAQAGYSAEPETMFSFVEHLSGNATAISGMLGGLVLLISCVCFKTIPSGDDVESFIKSAADKGFLMFRIMQGQNALVKFYETLKGFFMKIFQWCLGKSEDELAQEAQLADLSDNMKEWAVRVMQLKSPEMTGLIQTDLKLRHEVFRLYEQSQKFASTLASTKTNQNYVQTFRMFQSDCFKLYELARKPLLYSTVRIDPFCVAIFGDTNIGKSAIMYNFINSVADSQKLPDSNRAYGRAPALKHWDGYSGQFAVIQDDFAQVKMAEDIAECFLMKTNAEFMPPMAKLEEKGMKFSSLMLLQSTNVSHPEPTQIICHAALHRRRDILIECAWRDPEVQIRKHDLSHAKFRIIDASRKKVILSDWMLIDGISHIVCERYVEFMENQYGLVKGLTKNMPLQAPDLVPIPPRLPEQFINGIRVRQLAGALALEELSSDEEEENAQAQGFHVFGPQAFWRPVKPCTEQQERFMALLTELDPLVDSSNNLFLPEQFLGINTVVWEYLATLAILHPRYHDMFAVVTEDLVETSTQNLLDAFHVMNHYETYVDELYLVIQKKELQLQFFDKAKLSICDKIRVVMENSKIVGMLFAAVSALTICYFSGRYLYDAMFGAVGENDAVEAAIPSGDQQTRKLAQMKISTEAAIPSGDQQTRKLAQMRIQTEGTPVPKPRMMAAMTEGCSDPNTMAIYQHKIRQAICEIKGTRNLYCIFIYNRNILLPAHFRIGLKEMDVVTINVKGIDHKFGWEEKRASQLVKLSAKGNDKITHKDCYEDWFIYELPATVPPHGFDIRSHFVAEDDLPKLEKTEAILCSRPSGVDTHRMVNAKLETEAFMTEDLEGGTIHKFALARRFTYKAPTQVGDCGSPLLALNPYVTGKILGMHVAGQSNNTGHAIIITREMLESKRLSMGPELLPVAGIQAVQCRVTDGTDIYPMVYGPRILVLGKSNPNDEVHQPTKTTIKDSLISELIYKKESAPAILSRKDPRNPPNWDPLEEGLQKYNSESSDFHQPHVDEVFEFTRQEFFYKSKDYTRRILTEDEMINGIEGLEYFDAVNMQTSPGWPYTKLRKAGSTGKEMFFGMTPEGKRFVNHPLLRERLDSRETLAKQGIRIESEWIDCLKDERRAFEKVHKPRVFNVGPMDHTLLIKKYFGSFTAWYMDSRREHSGKVGMNVDSTEWDELVRKMKKVGTHGFDGDYSKYDSKMRARMIVEYFGGLVNAWYDDGPENARLRYTLLDEVAHTVHRCGSTVFETFMSNKSGFALTSILNSIVGDAYLKIGWLWCMTMAARKAELDEEPEKFKRWIILRSLAMYDRMTCASVYGDDNQVAVHESCLEAFNARTFGSFLKAHGIDYTPAAKGERVSDYDKIEDLQFLKRHIVKHEVLDLYQAPIDKQVIQDLTNFIRKSPNDERATVENCENSLRFAYQWGREYFNAHRSKVNTALQSMDIPPIMFTFDDFDREYIEAAC